MSHTYRMLYSRATQPPALDWAQLLAGKDKYFCPHRIPVNACRCGTLVNASHTLCTNCAATISHKFGRNLPRDVAEAARRLPAPRERTQAEFTVQTGTLPEYANAVKLSKHKHYRQHIDLKICESFQTHCLNASMHGK